MKTEVRPQDTSRSEAFSLWMSSPMPMVTFTKTFNVTRLVRLARKHGMKFNMLLCWCIVRAASKIDEFYFLPFRGKLYRYDRLSVDVVVSNIKGGLNFCNVPLTDTLEEFNREYLRLIEYSYRNCENHFLEDTMAVGTTTVLQTELDCLVNMFAESFPNPLLLWARYRRHWFRYYLPISFQFNHLQMDGSHAASFFVKLQEEIDNLKI